MTNTKASLSIIGGLALSFALVSLDTLGVSNIKGPEIPDTKTQQVKRQPIHIKDSAFAQGLFR